MGPLAERSVAVLLPDFCLAAPGYTGSGCRYQTITGFCAGTPLREILAAAHHQAGEARPLDESILGSFSQTPQDSCTQLRQRLQPGQAVPGARDLNTLGATEAVIVNFCHLYLPQDGPSAAGSTPKHTMADVAEPGPLGPMDPLCSQLSLLS